jgi:3-phenylpropionate/trans-cinnamate dioxygenase ferredoxin subunit
MKVKVCAVGEIPPDGAAAFDVNGTKVCIANVGSSYFAVGDTCTHAEASLSEGYVDVSEVAIECPLHNAVFSLKSGEALEFPAEDPVESYPVTVEDDVLYIDMPEA